MAKQWHPISASVLSLTVFSRQTFSHDTRHTRTRTYAQDEGNIFGPHQLVIESGAPCWPYRESGSTNVAETGATLILGGRLHEVRRDESERWSIPRGQRPSDSWGLRGAEDNISYLEMSIACVPGTTMKRGMISD